MSGLAHTLEPGSTITDRQSTAESARAAATRSRTEALLSGGGALLAYAAMAWYLTLHLHIQYIDTLARVSEAYFVAFSRDPHLAALGFVWPPLPSLLVLPLLFLHWWIPALTWYGFAGNIESCFTGALAVYFVNSILQSLSIPRPWRILATIAFALNPMITLYGANGLSEMFLIALVLGAIHYALEFLRTRSVAPLAVAGALLGISMFVRYESVPFALTLGVGLAIGLWMEGADRKLIEGATLVFFAPIAFAGSLWMYVNWLIMGSPTYFAHSNYSNAAQVGAGFYNAQSGAAAAAHSLIKSLVYVGNYYHLFVPVVIGLLGGIILVFGRRRDSRMPMLMLAAIASPLLQLALTYIHQTAGWDRFFIYLIPMGFVLLAVLASNIRHTATYAVMVALLIFGDYTTFATFQNPYLATQYDYPVVQAILKGKPTSPYADVAPVINFINGHPKDTFLMETFNTLVIYMRVRNPKQIIANSDRQFLQDLEAPLGRVNYFLLPQVNSEDGAVSTMAHVFPSFWYGKPVKWAKLVKVFPGSKYRLYKIVAQPPLEHNA